MRRNLAPTEEEATETGGLTPVPPPGHSRDSRLRPRSTQRPQNIQEEDIYRPEDSTLEEEEEVEHEGGSNINVLIADMEERLSIENKILEERGQNKKSRY